MAAVVDNNGNAIAGVTVAQVGAAAFNPAGTSAAYDVMRDRLWELDTTWGGTESLRAAGERMLPRFERESAPDHAARLKAARLLRNLFRQSVERTVGRLFEVPVRLASDKGVAIGPGDGGWFISDDADLMGSSFDRVARDYARGALRRGLAHILVDYPVGDYANLAEERRANPRPYLKVLDPQQVLECYEVDGITTYLRWYERRLEWDPDHSAVVMTEFVHERMPGRYKVWKQVSEALKVNAAMLPGAVRRSWVVDKEGTVSQPRVMLHTLYAEREDHMVGRTPLTEVKDLTLEVWELGSDLKNCLQQVLFPLFYAVGIDAKTAATIELGPKTILGSDKSDAKFGYAEHTGAAIKSGQEHIQALEQRAEAYAGQLTRPSGDVKATQTAVSTAEVSSWVKDFGLTLQDKLQAIIDDCALWAPAIGAPRVTVNLDFAVDLPDGDLAELGNARRAGDLSRPVYVRELQRRNALSSDFDADENDQQLSEEQAEGMEREKEMMRQTALIEAPRQPGGSNPAQEDE